MANEITARWHDSGVTLYAQVIDATGNVYNGSTFETPADANWGTYDIPLTEAGTTRIYRATFPAVAAGVYSIFIYLQAGASPAVADTIIGLGDMQWSGTAAVVTGDLPTNTELTSALAAADDAVLTAIALLNNLSSAGAQAAAAAALTAYDAATATQVSAVTAPSAATVADAVWDEALSGHLTAGSTGAGLNAAGSVGDPWATTLPGGYSGDQAGNMLDRIESQLLTAGAALVSVITDGDSITAIRGDEFSLSFTSLGSVSGRSKLWFTVKTRTSHGDDDAMIQIAESGGLLFIAGAAAETAANGSLTVTDQNDGDMTITLAAAETAKMPADRALYYDVQVLGSGGVQTLTAGRITFTADVTRATS